MISKIFILSVLIGYIVGASLENRQVDFVDSCPLVCTDEWMPLCGSDGKTYGNMCEFKHAHCHTGSLTVAHVGSCKGQPA